MTFAEKTAVIQQFVESFNSGDLDSIDRYIARDFFNYAPPAGEETAPQVLRPLARDLRHAIPDLKLEATDFVDGGDVVTFSLTMSGTHENELWGAPGHGEHGSWTSTVTTRFEDGMFAFSWEDLPVREILGALRQIGMVPAPEDMDKPHKYPISVPEILLRLVFTGQVADKECTHLDKIQVVDPTTDVCEQCVASGDVWPALRMCLICGFVGCCDTSKNKHMKQHYQDTGHSIFRSIRLEEGWVWCYEDSAFFGASLLDRYRE
jgi:predicted ester cyclase